MQDSFGQDVPTWTDVATVWAAVQPLRGQNLALAQAFTLSQTATHKITIRYNSQLVGQNSYRILLQPDSVPLTSAPDFEDLDDSDFADLDDSDFADLPNQATYETFPPRIFTIQQMDDENERHRQIDIMATEIKL